jgi:threonine synthase
VLGKYRGRTGDNTYTVVVSTASPFKFCDSVLDALGKDASMEGLALIDALEEASDIRAPAPLKALRGKPVRFTGCVERADMAAAVERFLNG